MKDNVTINVNKAYIPAKTNVHSTSDVDGVNTAFGYWGPLSYPMRRRLDMVVQAMRQGRRYTAILDCGYGCGIFLADLYRRLAPEGVLYGIDIHNEHEGIYRKMIPAEGLKRDRVILSTASLAELPFPNGMFDLVVSVSVLEHISRSLLRPCLQEIKRVAAKDADIIIGFPTDCLFIRMLARLQKQDLKKNHPSTHRDIFEAIAASGFKIVNITGFPRFSGPLTMHYNLRLEGNQ